MRFHCLGVGSIGSLLAANLAQLPSTQVRLILRRKDLAAQLLTPGASGPDGLPSGTLTIERSGLARRTSGLEMELTRSPHDVYDHASASTSSNGYKIVPQKWHRVDPIDALVITTKAPQTLPAVKHLLGRLSSRSVVVLCQNGMGVLESLLEEYWPQDRSDELEQDGEAGRARRDGFGARPSFVCATTSHGAWRKGGGHFVHAGMGDIKFGVLPNRAVLSAIANYPNPPWLSPADNPLLNPRSLVQPSLTHLPETPVTANLYSTLSALTSLNELDPSWLPLPAFQIAQLQKLAVNASVNSLTALAGVNNGALVGSQKAKRLIEAVSRECSDVFAAHLAREEGSWTPPPRDLYDDFSDSSPDPAAHPPPPPLPPAHPLAPRSLLDYTERVLFKTAPNVSSTLSDLLSLQSNSPRGRFSFPDHAPSLPTRTEIDFINGYVVALGRKYGIRTETVKALGDLVLLKEEMGRVGAIDRVWAGSRRGSGSGSPERPPRQEKARSYGTPQRAAGAGGEGRRTPLPSGGSIFSGSSGDEGAGSPRPPRARKQSPHERGAEQLARTRENDGRREMARMRRIAKMQGREDELG
ncbi:hypothetical protein Rhopal_002556-T1 [Rhodotorula paludigena]|uniref:2-dehydropantoate 2-reductase n=1 Tax=Rhodotorula paludigena TaxID=86838 RepID=A0AAV5GK24_9BASI|nr:hypothetical protein Rhopal_002556-T1 [Rhodotorula paludigena]